MEYIIYIYIISTLSTWVMKNSGIIGFMGELMRRRGKLTWLDTKVFPERSTVVPEWEILWIIAAI